MILGIFSFEELPFAIINILICMLFQTSFALVYKSITGFKMTPNVLLLLVVSLMR